MRLRLLFALAAGLWAAAASAAGTAAPKTAPAKPPLSYMLTLGPQAPLGLAGARFLGDPAAQQWFIQNRPQDFPLLVRNAFAAADWRELLDMHDDPARLREAIMAREETRYAQDPAAFLKLTEEASGLPLSRAHYEAAVLDWNALDAEARKTLEGQGLREENWRRMALSARYLVMRALIVAEYRRRLTASPGDPHYHRQLEAALPVLLTVLTSEEVSSFLAGIERAKSLDRALKRAEKKALKKADETAAALLGEARRAADIDAAEALLSQAAARLGRPVDAARPPPLSAEETRLLERRLSGAIVQALRGTALGEEMLAALAEAPVFVKFGRTASPDTGAHYERGRGLIVFGLATLERTLADMGRAPRELLEDDEALADAAVVYSHIFVHEATHHRQFLRLKGRPEQVRALLYSQVSEAEANNAEAVFLEQKRAADPAFAAREQRLVKRGAYLRHLHLDQERRRDDPRLMSHWITYGYSGVPSFARLAARAIDSGLAVPRFNAEALRHIDAELARRSRLPAAERLRLGRAGHLDAASDRVVPARTSTGALRRLRDYLRGHGEFVLSAVNDFARVTFAEAEKLAR